MLNVGFKNVRVLSVKVVCHFSFPVASIMHGTEYEMNTFYKSARGPVH